MDGCRGLVRVRGAPVSRGPDAFLPLDVRRHGNPPRACVAGVIGYAGMAVLFYTARWTTEEGGGH